MKNLNILKEAMADAKSLQEVAIRNAKKTLEENFTPHLRSMLTKKLEEMEAEEMDETMTEEIVEEEMNIEDILAEIEAMDDELTEAKDSEKESDDDEKEEKPEKKEKPEKDDSEKEEETSIEDMSEEELKSFIEEVIGDMVSKGELEPGEQVEDDSISDDSMGDDMDLGFDLEDDEMSAEEDEDINIDSLLEEFEEEELMQEDNIEEGIDATELTKIAQSTGMSLDAVKALIALAGFVGIPALSALAIITKEGISKLFDKLKSKADSTASVEEEEIMEGLRKQLKETKILNAKLFYTVEIFNLSKSSLNETQKLGVLKAFDKATSVQEAKLVYETLKDKFTNTKKTSIQERRIGSASKVIENTTKKSLLKENNIIDNDIIDRFQKLAGI